MTFPLSKILCDLNHLGSRSPGRRLEPFRTVSRQHSPSGSLPRIEPVGRSGPFSGLVKAAVEQLASFAGLQVTKSRQHRYT